MIVSRVLDWVADRALAQLVTIGWVVDDPHPAPPPLTPPGTPMTAVADTAPPDGPASPPIDLPAAERSPVPRPEKLSAVALTRLRTAMYKATTVYPGPVGELLSRELSQWETFGYRFGDYGLVLRLIEDILTAAAKAEAADPVTAGA